MNRLLWLTLLAVAIAQQVWAQDIVYSSARLEKRNGAYYPTGRAHLYRAALGGRIKGQLTDGDFDDTDPCLSPDRRHILFLRRDKLDLVGGTWLCRVRIDGTGLAAVWRFDGPVVSTPVEILNAKRSDPNPDIDLGTWAETGDGDNGFEGAEETRIEWLDSAKTGQLYELPAKTPDGCWPVIYQIDAHNHRCVGKLRGYALEDVDPKKSTVLISKWRWGSRRSFDGAWPVGTLALWSPSKGITPISLLQGAIRGACFCPTAGRVTAAKRNAPTRSRKTRVTGPIVFSASRYADRFQVPIEIDRPHLYSMNADGSGIKELTFGDHSEIDPSISNDGKHILFWRTRADDNGWKRPYDLYRMELDGSKIESLGLHWSGGPSWGRWRPEEFEANAFEAFGRDPLQLAVDHHEDKILIRTSHGRKSIRGDHFFLAPDGRHVLVASYGKEENYLVDLGTGASRDLSSAFTLPTWLDPRTIVAVKHSEGTVCNIVLIGLTGKPTSRLQASQGKEEEGDPDLASEEETVHAFHLGPGRDILWVFHHSMSDGGYDATFLIRPKLKKIEVVGSSTEAVSPNGARLLNADFGWFGGYKRHGAEKVCTLTIANLTKGEGAPVGFRRMICYGACWVR